jgi:hypothetical protein
MSGPWAVGELGAKALSGGLRVAGETEAGAP